MAKLSRTRATALGESAQALFCAISDYLGSSKADEMLDLRSYPTYETFKQVYDSMFPTQTLQSTYNRYVNSPGVTFSDVEKYMGDEKSWYASSVQIAKAVIKEISSIDSDFSKIKNSGWQDIVYVRGDKDVMQNIEALFKLAQKNEENLNRIPGGGRTVPLADVNKWSPADIYFASDVAKRKIKETLREKSSSTSNMSYAILNALVSGLIDSGDLLPLSLKKQPKNVTISKVNFDRKAELKYISQYKFVKLKWQPYKTGVARDITIFMNPKDPRAKITLRHSPEGTGPGTFRGDAILGSEARGGGLARGPFIAVLRTVDSAFASKLDAQFNKNLQEFSDAKKLILPLRQKDRKTYDILNAENSGVYMNPSFKMLADWLKSNQKRSDAFVQQVYAYASSRSENSGKFVIAK